MSLFSLNFNPRSPWGERQSVSSDVHSDFVFQSTLPVGGATRIPILVILTMLISIHAPRGGSDVKSPDARLQDPISIHAPRGGSDPYFIPTGVARLISIHAPRGGSDS